MKPFISRLGRLSLLAAALGAGATLLALPAAAQAVKPSSLQAELAPVLAGSWRSEQNRARDVYRHPKETLEFFGVKPEMTVIELLPGGAGAWWPEVLGPLLNEKGQYIGANFDPAQGPGEREKASMQRTVDGLKTKFASNPQQFSRAREITFLQKTPNLGAPGSADVVLTFRNVHNWVEDNTLQGIFKAAFEVLKPGGVFGVEDHRAAKGKNVKEVVGSGYLPVEFVVEQAKAAGFVLDGSSEVNANAKDTKDHPRGVWTLPPVLANKDVDREKYLAIGESDRMTLRFVKPK